MAMKIKKTQNVHVDEGKYKAVVANIEEKSGGKFDDGTFYQWTFLVKNATNEDKPLEGKVRVTGLTSAKFSELSKLYKWARACGLDVTKEEIDLEKCLKAVVMIKLEDEEDKEGRTWSKIVRISQLKGAAAPADDSEEEEDDEEEKPKHKVAKKPAKEEEEDTEEEEAEEEAEEEEEVKKPAKKVVKKPAKKDDDEEEEEEEDEAPPKESSKKPGKKVKKDEEEEDPFDFETTDDDDEE